LLECDRDRSKPVESGRCIRGDAASAGADTPGAFEVVEQPLEPGYSIRKIAFRKIVWLRHYWSRVRQRTSLVRAVGSG
jgi:hypothetical protein